MLFRLALFGALTAAAPALAATAGSDSLMDVRYACADNKTLQVVFVNTASGTSWAIIEDVDEMIPLKIAESASGARYVPISKNYTYELLTKGKTADLYGTTDGKEEVLRKDCQEAN